MLVCQELPGQEVSCHDPLQIRLEPMERQTLQCSIEHKTTAVNPMRSPMPVRSTDQLHLDVLHCLLQTQASTHSNCKRSLDTCLGRGSPVNTCNVLLISNSCLHGDLSDGGIDQPTAQVQIVGAATSSVAVQEAKRG